MSGSVRDGWEHVFGMDTDPLTSRVAAGVTVAELARELRISPAQTRRALANAGLQTARQRTLKLSAEARGRDEAYLLLACPVHGDLLHGRDARGTYRCPKCNAGRVAQRRRSVKDQLVAEAGGACRLCGYGRCSRALGFHHVDPTAKAFGLAFGGISRSMEKARAEAAKCVLLCANCHMEVESGTVCLSLVSPGAIGGNSIGRVPDC